MSTKILHSIPVDFNHQIFHGKSLDNNHFYNFSFLNSTNHIYLPGIAYYKELIEQKIWELPSQTFLDKAFLLNFHLNFSFGAIKFNEGDFYTIIGKSSIDDLSDISLGKGGLNYYYAQFRFPVTGHKLILEAVSRLLVIRDIQLQLHFEQNEAYFSFCSYSENDIIADEKILQHLNDICEKNISILQAAIAILNDKIDQRNEEIKAFTQYCIEIRKKQISLAA